VVLDFFVGLEKRRKETTAAKHFTPAHFDSLRFSLTPSILVGQFCVGSRAPSRRYRIVASVGVVWVWVRRSSFIGAGVFQLERSQNLNKTEGRRPETREGAAVVYLAPPLGYLVCKLFDVAGHLLSHVPRLSSSLYWVGPEFSIRRGCVLPRDRTDFSLGSFCLAILIFFCCRLLAALIQF
jgi:hypothetical protein